MRVPGFTLFWWLIAALGLGWFASGCVHCPDGTVAVGPDVQTDRAIEPGYCR